MLVLSEFSFALAVPYVPWVIAGLVVWGALCQSAAWLSYSREIKYTGRLDRKIRDLLQEPQERAIMAEELLGEEQVPEESMVATRTLELEKFAQYPGMVALHDLGAVAAEADAGRLRNAFPGVLIASLLVCGLLGTLMSLKETLPKANISKDRLAEMRVSELGATAEYADNLKDVTEGFGEAFLASIFGVGGTLVLITGRIFVRDRRERSFCGIEKFVVERLLPYYIKPEKTQLQRASAALDEAHTRFDEIHRQMSASSSAIQKALERLEGAAKQADKTFGANGPVTLGLKGFSKETKAYNDNAAALVETQKKSAEVLGELSSESKKLIVKIDKKSEEDKENHNKSLSQIVLSIEELMTEMSSGGREIIKKIDEKSEEDKVNHNKSLDQMAILTKDLMGDSNKVKEAVATSVNELKESQTTVVLAIKQGSDALLENGNKLKGSMSESIGGLLDALKIQNDDLITQLTKSYKGHLGSASQVNTNLIDNLGVLSKQLEQIVLREDRIDIDAFKEFERHLASIDTKLERVITANADAIKNTRESHLNMDREMMKAFGEFSKRIKVLSGTIDKIAKEDSVEHQNMATKIRSMFRSKNES